MIIHMRTSRFVFRHSTDIQYSAYSPAAHDGVAVIEDERLAFGHCPLRFIELSLYRVLICLYDCSPLLLLPLRRRAPEYRTHCLLR